MASAAGTPRFNCSPSGPASNSPGAVLHRPPDRRFPMEIALYVRVSTRRQAQTQTIDQQLDRLQMHVASHSEWHLAAEHIYRDDGFSGSHLHRPGLDRLRDHARLGRFRCVLITAPDRLARSFVHQVLLINELSTEGCAVEFLDRPMSDD